MIELEKRGIPTVTAATSEFIALAKSSALSFGVQDLAFVKIPHPMGMIQLDEIRAKADAAFDAIVDTAVNWKPAAAPETASVPVYPGRTIQFRGTVEDVNDLFYRNGWTDGLPIIPPTPERVEEMLTGTTRQPDDVIGIVPPRMGVLTVEMAAVNAVMAGCKPEYMPVVITAMEAMLEPQHGWRGMVTTTNPVAPLVIVSGPIVDEIGIQYGAGAMAGGPGYRPNVAIGRAINLIRSTVGGSIAPNPDKSTLGQPANVIAMVVGENEKQSPWEPLRVRLGFDRNTSTVTVLGSEIPTNINDHNSTSARDLCETIAYTMNASGQNTRAYSDSEVVLLLSPEHAATIAADGWSIRDIQTFLYNTARTPLKYLPPAMDLAKSKGFMSNNPDELVPPVLTPDHIVVAVVGGPGKHSVYFSSFGAQTRMVTKEIKK